MAYYKGMCELCSYNCDGHAGSAITFDENFNPKIRDDFPNLKGLWCTKFDLPISKVNHDDKKQCDKIKKEKRVFLQNV